ncbi:MAG: sigma-54-dependent Fis family transcriptional regulator [Candidatus Tectomicrobia bacterium]|nr:sigma-54-dependent Fis family transcriptional regulator [Candidatus Tectomicrobia bacterium]
MAAASVLVIDDEREMREALHESLRRCGCEVLCVESGEQALTHFAERPFNAVITDVKLPCMNGLEVLARIKERSPLTPVIVITAYGSIDNAVDAMKRGAFDYVVKPFTSQTLEHVVRRALAGNHHSGRVGSALYEEVSGGRAIITEDAALQGCLELARHIAPTKATVLIQGESGTGKELFARFIHRESDRCDRPFVAVNCAALPEGLLESELFGHEKGSFTGAISRKIGKFELANRGTLLLDEITEMELPLQAKLLRVLQEQEIDRIGGATPVRLDLRIIATTNRELTEVIKAGRFREDLYYRLNVIPLRLPPLRDRPKDIPTLVEYFLAKHAHLHGRSVPTVEPRTLGILQACTWRGNVRELENIVERALLLSNDGELEAKHFLVDGSTLENVAGPEPAPKATTIQPGLTMREMEKQLIVKTLQEVGGNRTYAAKLLGISIRTLRNKLREYRTSGELANL